MVHGIHHITTIAGDSQKNYDFYTGVLGMRFIKRTVNFDDPKTYHLYFSDYDGNPGSVLTSFPWGEKAQKGRRGTGQVTTISFSVMKGSMEYWQQRLNKLGIENTGPFTRFGENGILLFDHDGFELEIIESASETRNGWDNGDIPEAFSIRGFHSASLSIEKKDKTEALLLGPLKFRFVNKDNIRFRYECGDGGPGTIIDLIEMPGSLSGRMGVGTVHHIAYRILNDEAQLELRAQIDAFGIGVTEVIDRNYFHSIYFREPGNVLFEGATDPPGFTIDETLEELGTHLKIPVWYEKYRNEIERDLPELKTKEIKKKP